MKVLAGDIGGTKTNLGIFEVENKQIQSLYEASWISADFTSLKEVLKQFLTLLDNNTGMSQFQSVCFGVAGPVDNNFCQITNLPWIIDAAKIQQQFNWPSVSLLNDLEANAWGISALQDTDFITLNPGDDEAKGNASIIAAGTGLGEAGMFWDGKQHIPFASEGGHTDFSPQTEKEYRLYTFLSKQYQGHVSWERIVSGMGLENLYQYLCHENNSQPPDWLAQQMQAGDTAAAISKAAVSGTDQLCVQALDWFVYFYGVEAANHALKIMSRGGVFLGGGIAPKIIKQLQAGRFMQAFLDKGRMQPLLKSMPVKVIMNDKTALYGPAIYAASHTTKSLEKD
ncbi:MAG: glucokinase [gamma proteobacterium symbiont of Taylorina sp.]|nr:glucokinase [gamma proteobacterium symbiont of Taylorina sp.]